MHQDADVRRQPAAQPIPSQPRVDRVTQSLHHLGGSDQRRRNARIHPAVRVGATDADGRGHRRRVLAEEKGPHQERQRVRLQAGVQVDHDDVRKARRVQRHVQIVGVAGVRLVDHEELPVTPRAIVAPHRARGHVDEHRWRHLVQLERVDQGGQRTARFTVVHEDDLVSRIAEGEGRAQRIDGPSRRRAAGDDHAHRGQSVRRQHWRHGVVRREVPVIAQLAHRGDEQRGGRRMGDEEERGDEAAGDREQTAGDAGHERRAHPSASSSTLSADSPLIMVAISPA